MFDQSWLVRAGFLGRVCSPPLYTYFERGLQMFVAIAYDISDDNRRNRLCKTLKNFGTHVQYSVFEVELSQSQMAQLKEAVKKVIKPSEDLVRYYHLCDACKRRIEVTPKSIVTVKPLTVII